MRLYRIPGTYNHKSLPAKLVKAIKYNASNRVSMEDAEALAVDDKAGDKPEEVKEYAPANHVMIAKECAWYGHITGEGAADCDEPNWHASGGITSCCKDGEETFHECSVKHPDYSHNEAQAKYDRASKVGPIPLGYTNNGNFVIRDQVRQVILIASPQQLLSVQYQLGLVDSGFWGSQFPSEKGLYASLQAGEGLLKACRQAVPFNPTRIRGRGVWLEDGQIVENLGTAVQPGLKHVYLCFERLTIDRKAKPEAKRLLKLLQSLPWRNEQDAVLFYGWLAVAPICGALTWRPHCFIYGPPNSGKTTAHNIASDILHPLRVSADGQSTEAGIRQSLGPDALPVIMDKFETGNNQRKQKAVMVLARSASSAESPVLRGTPEGQAIQFAIKTMFLWSAANVAEMVLSRLRSGLSTHLSGLSFECQGAFAT